MDPTSKPKRTASAMLPPEVLDEIDAITALMRTEPGVRASRSEILRVIIMHGLRAMRTTA